MCYTTIIKGVSKGSLFALLLLMTILPSCRKYLDKKRSDELAVPSTLKDLQALLDNPILNTSSPQYLEAVADNYYLSAGSYNGLHIDERMMYIWDKNARTIYTNWSAPYSAIYHSNFILDALARIESSGASKDQRDAIEGFALFARSFQFYQLAQLFCKPFSSTAAEDLGIVLRKTSVVQERSTRATVAETYNQIIQDLQTSADLLPATTAFSTQPDKAAAYGLLARVYLSMRDYPNALKYADLCLGLQNELLDYNQLSGGSSSAFPTFLSNPEVIFLNFATLATPTDASISRIDPALYGSYHDNDLRKSLFFGLDGAANPYWKGSYMPDVSPYTVFDGIAVDEIYLIRAECRARAGDAPNAMMDLNTLLRKRWLSSAFVDLTASDAAAALQLILQERRKELIYRGQRWTDLRRFNLEDANITLTRTINSATYTLPPNDLRWVWLIPDQEIIRSGFQQNPR
jgi:starch-binding outer membrane protein, SusD/RagB family